MDDDSIEEAVDEEVMGEDTAVETDFMTSRCNGVGCEEVAQW